MHIHLQNQNQTTKKMARGTYISIITLNINELNAPTKSHRLAEWIKKNKTYIYTLHKKPTSDLKTHIDKVRRWKNILLANRKQNKAGVAILISDKSSLK